MAALSSRFRRALLHALRLRCPRCGRAPLFRRWFVMNTVCAVCDLVFERAQGYWVGAIYVNYAVTTSIAVAGYLVLWRFMDLATRWQLALWVPFAVVFPLWFFPYSRSLWLAVEYAVNPEL
jgi:uncharacterized protein (DUF983 family)